ncbi:MAG: hypothetical protein HYZ81_01750 [Nitrospinae bacterium]|nr:hypothetical protein [Nitrospinota bacterium]
MSVAALERLVRKYYGYVADLEGSGVEVLDLLCVRDKIQAILDRLPPEVVVPAPRYERIYDLDAWLWQERARFLMVVGEKELPHARAGERSPRSHWWWYLDALKAPVPPTQAQAERLAKAVAPARR